ncbi:MAG: FGGY family carbohydrate kinase [Geminicoccaceae bacterium]
MAVAIFDSGKTNLKLLLIDAGGRVVAQRSTPNRAVDGPPYRHIDLAAVETWLLGALREVGQEAEVEAFVTSAHGSAAVLVDADGPVLPMIDYEGTAPADLMADYAEVMPPFLERGSAVMGDCAHIGRQLFWQARDWPDAVARARHYLTLPQYWAWRLCGVAASEVTSLAAQSHLWDAPNRRWSSLVEVMGWERLLPPLRPAWDRLGTLKPEVAKATGLSPSTPVLSGIHDSTANWYRYAAAGIDDATIASTGTWVVLLDPDTPLSNLSERRGMTVNAAPDGRPLAGVLAMIGREFERLTGGQRVRTRAEDVAGVVAQGTMALPGFSDMDGIFPGSARKGRIVGPAPSEAAATQALATVYAALVTDRCLDLLGSRRRIVLDGGFTVDPSFAGLLAALRPGQEVLVEPSGAGAAVGAALLVRHGEPEAAELNLLPATPVTVPGLEAYAGAWREAVEPP